MRNLEKYKGIIPAFYACYDDEGKNKSRTYTDVYSILNR